jgi:hypothetical protein
MTMPQHKPWPDDEIDLHDCGHQPDCPACEPPTGTCRACPGFILTIAHRPTYGGGWWSCTCGWSAIANEALNPYGRHLLRELLEP